jgi:hypothetical protein
MPFDINVALAWAIVDTVREPFLVLDRDLRVVVASRSFYTTFQIGPNETQVKLLYDQSDGEWNIAALRLRRSVADEDLFTQPLDPEPTRAVTAAGRGLNHGSRSPPLRTSSRPAWTSSGCSAHP